MIRRGEQMNEIIKGLSLLQYYIKFSSNKLGLHDINKVCEPFFCELFNILWDKDLKRLEHVEKNFPSIDLADDKEALAIQITSNGSKQKLWDTVNKFEEKKLYKKYTLLYHFIIGEKHYTPRKSDQISFKNIQYNVYCTNRKISDKYIYQIQIIDILDLILLIDESDNLKINQICEYITSNVGVNINKFQQTLYQIETNEITPFTAIEYIKYLEIGDVHFEKAFYNDLKIFADTLNSLDENNRRALYKILKNHIDNGKIGDEIKIDPRVLKRLLNTDENSLYEEIKILDNFNLLYKNSLEDEGIIEIHYCDSEGNEMINELCKYCFERNVSLFEIIVNLNFSLLD